MGTEVLDSHLMRVNHLRLVVILQDYGYESACCQGIIVLL